MLFWTPWPVAGGPPKPTAGSFSGAYGNKTREAAHLPAMGALPLTALGWNCIQKSLRYLYSS